MCLALNKKSAQKQKVLNENNDVSQVVVFEKNLQAQNITSLAPTSRGLFYFINIVKSNT